MRIITGKLKGRNIPIPNTGKLRPTSDRAKEALFGIIAARRYFDSTTVLDLFAGSGNLGFEALSRGSKQVVFVDQEPEHIKQIEKTAADLGVDSQIHGVTTSVEHFLENPDRQFDFIFADPPYDYFNMENMVNTILESEVLHPDGWFVLEHDKGHDFSAHEKCTHSRAYGRTIVTIFKHSDLND